jgi:MFS family permease
MAPLYATLMTIVKKNMDMTGKTTSLFPVGNAVGMTIVPFLAGVLFEYTGGASIFLVVSVTGVLAMGVAFYLRPHMVFEN